MQSVVNCTLSCTPCLFARRPTRVKLLYYIHNGTWRSPVAHLNGVQGVAGSNPAVPTGLNASRGVTYTLRLFHCRVSVYQLMSQFSTDFPQFVGFRHHFVHRRFVGLHVAILQATAIPPPAGRHHVRH